MRPRLLLVTILLLLPLTAKGARDAFRVECLHPVDNAGGYHRFMEEPPLYEHYGEKQVLAGYYPRVVRYREQITPLAEALRSYSQRNG